MNCLDSNATKALKGPPVTDAPQLGALLDGPNPFIAVSVLGKTLLGHAEASLEEVTGQRRKQTSLRSLRPSRNFGCVCARVTEYLSRFGGFLSRGARMSNGAQPMSCVMARNFIDIWPHPLSSGLHRKVT